MSGPITVGRSSRPLAPERVRAWQILALVLVAIAATTWTLWIFWPELLSLSVDQIRRQGPGLVNVVVGLLFYGILLLLLLVLPVRQMGHTLRSIVQPVPSRSLASWSVRVGLALFLLGMGTMYLVNLPLAYAYPEFVSRWVLVASHGTIFRAGILASALAVVEVAVVVAFVEELIFRGLILPSWEARWGPRWAVVLSSLVWTLVHPHDVVGALVFGVVAAVAYLRTRMLLVPFLIHAANNAAVWPLAPVYEILPRGSPFATLEAFRAHWWMGVIGLLLGAPWLWHLMRSQPVLRPDDVGARAEDVTGGGETPRGDLPATPR